MVASAVPPRFFPRPVQDVLRELSDALQNIECQIAVVSDKGNDAHELAVVLPMLIEARDVCALASLNGPHLLLVEMVHVVEGVIEGDFERPEEANKALMFAAANLPGYVQRISLGGRDIPLALMPVLNDLRAVRGAPLFSDALMRLPLFRLPPDDLGASSAADTLAATARRVRPHFMRALLNAIRGESEGRAFELMASSLNTLRDSSRRRSVRMLWLIARAVVDGLHSGALDLTPATKTLLGQIERCVKLGVEHGERDLVVSLPPELLRNMLFYCAQAGDASDVLTVVRQRYRLDDLVSGVAVDADPATDRGNAALAPGLLIAARDQIQSELDRVRDAVLAFAHSDVSAEETLRPAGLLLSRVCETLDVLGMTSTRTTLFASVPMFRGIRDRHSNARALATLAEALLQGSRLLESEVDRLSDSRDDLDCSQELDIEQSALSRMPRDERKQLLKAVITQLRGALENFEVAVVGGLASDSDAAGLAIRAAGDGLREAKHALDIVSLRAAQDAFSRLVNVLAHISALRYRSLDENSPVVRVVASLDLYLRALEENNLNGRGFLRACFTSLAELEQQCSEQLLQANPVQQVAASPRIGGEPVVRAVQPEQLLEGHPLDGDDGTPQYRADAELRAIYVAEAVDQLRALREYTDTRLDNAGGLPVDEHIGQLLDTLVRRSQLAEVGGIAVPLLQLKRIFSHYRRSSASVSAIEMDLVERTFASVETSLDNLTAERRCDPAAEELSRELASLAAVLGLDGVGLDDDSAEELHAVFAEEAEELMAAATTALTDWQTSPADAPAQQRLMRSLHTLKGSARVAGWDTVSEAAHALESLVIQAGGSAGLPVTVDFTALQSGLDHIAELLCRDTPAPGISTFDADLTGSPTVVDIAAVDRPEAVSDVVDPPEDAVSPEDVTDDILRVSSQQVGSLTALANDVALHRVAVDARLIDAQERLDEITRLVRRIEEQTRVLGRARDNADLPQTVQETLRDFDSMQQGVRDQLRMSRATLDAQRQSGTALHDGLLKLRLVRFSSLEARLKRVVRQSAAAGAKAVSLRLVGADLTVDRGLLARLIGPLEQLVRNAVIHGIESIEERRRRNKELQGHILVQAFQQHGSLQVRVADDGRGIDLESVRDAALARGLELPEDEDAQVRLILSPGFSTSEAVDEHAGRGVGLDVVNQQIRASGGSLSIQTQSGSGAVFGLRVPQSLSIENAILVRVGSECHALPVNQVVSVEQVPSAIVRDAYAKEIGTYGHAGRSFPIQHLGALLGTTNWRPEGANEHANLVLIDAGDQRVALHVDGIVGQRELPVQRGGEQLQSLRGYSGASVLADGDVVLLLDVAGLLLERAGHEALVEIGDETRLLVTAVSSCVMVVDDSVTMRRANGHVLGKGGYRVVFARNGLDALEKLEAHAVDAIVLDLDMPGMNGFELLERLREDERMRSLPVVVVSSQSDESSRARVAEFGVAHFLDKPCSGQALLDTVDRALELGVLS